MPQRFLRPGLTTSQRFNSASWHAQIFYVRILTLVDDFGRYDAETRLLRSHAFPFGDPAGKEIPLKTVESICKQLSVHALIAFYQDKDGKKYLQVLRWQERPRAEKSKYPALDNTCEQMFANDSNCSLPSPSPSPSPTSSIIGSSPNGQRPTIKDVVELIGERAANDFFDYYESNGWRVGRNPMKDWKAAARRWKRNQKSNGARPDNPGTIDKSKIDVPERFKAWVAERYPARRSDAMKWQTWADVPRNGLRDEWWKEEKSKLPIGEMM